MVFWLIGGTEGQPSNRMPESPRSICLSSLALQLADLSSNYAKPACYSISVERHRCE